MKSESFLIYLLSLRFSVSSSLFYSLDCQYTCHECLAAGYDACTTCLPQFYKMGTKCQDECPRGYYDDETRTCKECPNGCSDCALVESVVRCHSCIDNYKYDITSGTCSTECPSGKYYERGSKSCLGKTVFNLSYLDCHSLCTACDGPTQYECLACTTTSTIHGVDSCNVPFCMDNEYWVQSTEECKQCDSSCKTCTSGSSTQCTSCRDDLILSEGSCVHCNASAGMELVESEQDFQCKEICGDGILLGQYGCDDGNKQNGDG